MKSRRSVDTELLYRGNHIPGIAELPDTPPIYHATAYAVKDTDDYDRANRGEKYFYIAPDKSPPIPSLVFFAVIA